MMDGYLAKNTPWSRNFLQEFAKFEFKLPNSVTGTDNGAIHVRRDLFSLAEKLQKMGE